MTVLEPTTERETAPPALRRTPLFDAHVAHGAKMVPFAGWEMPVQYRGVLPEARAVRDGAGLFDVSHMGRVRVRGPRAFAYLQYLTVNDVSRLPTGGHSAQYSLLCRDAGGVIDDIIVYRLGPDEFIVVVNAANRNKDLAWMRGHAGAFPGLILEDETLDTALIAVQGPRAIALVDGLSDRDVTVLPRFGVDESAVADLPALLARTGYTGEDGVEVFCRARDAARLWAALTHAGGVPCGLGARDTLRVEAALPLYGHEMDEHTHPFLARLGWVFRADKAADYVGKAALTDLRAAPKTKVLVGVTMENRAIPRDGYRVLAGGEVVGHVTSGTFSPTLGKGIALARVQSASARIGMPLEIVIRDLRHPARVAALPFVKNV